MLNLKPLPTHGRVFGTQLQNLALDQSAKLS